MHLHLSQQSPKCLDHAGYTFHQPCVSCTAIRNTCICRGPMEQTTIRNRSSLHDESKRCLYSNKQPTCISSCRVSAAVRAALLAVKRASIRSRFAFRQSNIWLCCAWGADQWVQYTTYHIFNISSCRMQQESSHITLVRNPGYPWQTCMCNTSQC